MLSIKSKVKKSEKVENFAEFILQMTNIYSFLRNLFLQIWAKPEKKIFRKKKFRTNFFRKQFLPWYSWNTV